MTNKTKIWLSSPHMGGNEQKYIQEAFNNNWIAPLGPNVTGLEEDLKKILNKIGFKRLVHIPKKINSSGDFFLKIDRKSLKIINYLFADDFKNFHYKMVK